MYICSIKLIISHLFNLKHKSFLKTIIVMKKNLSKSLLRMLALLVLTAVPGVSHAATVVGDVNGDGKESIDDVVSLIDYLLSGDAGAIDVANADVDHDGRASIDDVVGLIDNLLSQPQTPDPVEGDWVDLGLPSGTIWATRNVGASSPEDYGDYFAWGETEPKDYYDWSTYKWCNGSDDSMTKYCTDGIHGYNGFKDGKTELDPEDDAAYVNWGPSWRMPTSEQQKELCEKCSSTWTTLNGVSGRLFTGPNGNTLFLPAAGGRWSELLIHPGEFCSAWSRTLSPNSSDLARCLYFESGYVGWNGGYSNARYFGFSVRAVRVSQN